MGKKCRGRGVGYWGCSRSGVLKQVASPNSSSEQVLWVLSRENQAAPKSALGSVSTVRQLGRRTPGVGAPQCSHSGQGAIYTPFPGINGQVSTEYHE